MSGTLREKAPGVWEVRFEAARDPVTGQRRQLSKRVHGNKRQAQHALNALVAEAGAGRYDGTSSTFGELVAKWLTLTEKDHSPTTFRTYRNLLKNHILPGLGDRPVNSIRTIDLDHLYQGLTSGTGLAPASVRQIHAIIRRAFRQAVMWGWVASNPAANATPPRLVKPKLSPPNAAQVNELLRYARKRDPELGHFLHISASTGARRGEVCALRWSNLDTKRKTLTIERSIVEVPGGLKEKDTKTHAERRIALDPVTLAIFESQRDIVTDRARQVGMKITANSFVFSREPDCRIPMTPGSVTKQFQAVRDALGYDNMRLHDLRHFAATRMMTAGIPVRTVSGRLGHANPATTLSVYTHFVEASDQDAAIVMGNILTEEESSPIDKPAPPVKTKKAVKAVKKTTRRSASV
jgi:integrase